MSCSCDFPALSNPYSSGQEAHRVWKTVNQRRYAITNCSALLCPITCPIRTIGLLTCCLLPGALCCSVASERKWSESIAFLPPYEDECTLLCCSILYPFHACPREVPDLYPYTFQDSWGLLAQQGLRDTYRSRPGPLIFGLGKAELGLRHEHYATGPERQIMRQGERLETVDARRKNEERTRSEQQAQVKQERQREEQARQREEQAKQAQQDAARERRIYEANEAARQDRNAILEKTRTREAEEARQKMEEQQSVLLALEKQDPVLASALRQELLLAKQNLLLEQLARNLNS